MRPGALMGGAGPGLTSPSTKGRPPIECWKSQLADSHTQPCKCGAAYTDNKSALTKLLFPRRRKSSSWAAPVAPPATAPIDPLESGARRSERPKITSNYFSGATGGLPLFSSPGEVAAGFSPLLLVATSGTLSVAVSLGGVAFDPDGRAASPVDDGSGVSAAKAEALVISTAAKSKLGSRYIGFSLSHRRKGNVGEFSLCSSCATTPGHQIRT